MAFFCPQTHPLRPWVQASTFSEHGHVAYQVKWNHNCSNMVANILLTDPHPLTPPLPTLGSLNFENVLMMHIKLNGVANAVI